MDESLSWEKRYKQLEAHHKEETEWLINEIKDLKREKAWQLLEKKIELEYQRDSAKYEIKETERQYQQICESLEHLENTPLELK